MASWDIEKPDPIRVPPFKKATFECATLANKDHLKIQPSEVVAGRLLFTCHQSGGKATISLDADQLRVLKDLLNSWELYTKGR